MVYNIKYAWEHKQPEWQKKPIGFPKFPHSSWCSFAGPCIRSLVCSECAQNHGAHIFKRNKFLLLCSASCGSVIQRINESANVRLLQARQWHGLHKLLNDCHINVPSKRSTVRGLWSPVPPDLNVTQQAADRVHSPLSAQGLNDIVEETFPLLQLNSVVVAALPLTVLTGLLPGMDCQLHFGVLL